MQYRPAFHSLSRGFAPRTPLHALSLAATPARAVRVARSRARSRVWLRPSDSPARSLARRDAGSRRSRGSLARSLARLASPLELPCTLSRSPRRRLAPFAWLARALARAFGFAPRTPLHALSR